MAESDVVELFALISVVWNVENVPSLRFLSFRIKKDLDIRQSRRTFAPIRCLEGHFSEATNVAIRKTYKLHPVVTGEHGKCNPLGNPSDYGTGSVQK